jgi:cyclase
VLKKRVIPVLSFNGFALVKTRQFANPRMVGNPIQAARIYNSRGVDELVFVDIFATAENRKLDLDIVADVLRECFMPVAVGGGITSCADISALLGIGADKVVIKSAPMRDRAFLGEASKRFGAQCLCVSVDAKRRDDRWVVYSPHAPAVDLDEFVKRVDGEGAGELLVNSVDNDGVMKGFDIDLMARVRALTSLPLIACGGAGEPRHFRELFERCNVDAAAAASIFHFTQYTPDQMKLALDEIGAPVRILRKPA